LSFERLRVCRQRHRAGPRAQSLGDIAGRWSSPAWSVMFELPEVRYVTSMTYREFPMRTGSRPLLITLFLTLASCTQSNPLLGKWEVIKNGKCLTRSIVFDTQTMTMVSFFKIPETTVPVTYKQGNGRFLVVLNDGTILTFAMEGEVLHRLDHPDSGFGFSEDCHFSRVT
jgi:hypothetical protein